MRFLEIVHSACLILAKERMIMLQIRMFWMSVHSQHTMLKSSDYLPLWSSWLYKIPTVTLFRRIRKIAKKRLNVVMSVCLHGTAWLPMDEFFWNLTFEYFLIICQENSGFSKILWEKWLLYMKTCVHLYLTEFFSEWRILQTEVVEKSETHILCSVHCFQKCAINEIMWKNTIEQNRPQVTV
jgi:hypothetical protein